MSVPISQSLSLLLKRPNCLLDLDSLPGCNPIQAGPNPATMVPNCNAPSTTTDAPIPTAPPAVATPPWTVCNTGPPVSDIRVPNCADYPEATKAPQAPAVVTAAPL